MDSLRILIVDDEDELVSALEERLNLRGFQAKGVTTGEEALAYLADRVLKALRWRCAAAPAASPLDPLWLLRYNLRA